jgi:hypothetical protein
MEQVISRGDLHCQPYFMHFVFQALVAADVFDAHAASQLERWHIVPDTESFYEMWDTGDLSHAWNGTPLYQMSGEILGVKPLEPGFKEFEIAPHPCGLKWAKGKVPTPHGNIAVSWTASLGSLEIAFTVPKGTVAVIGTQRFNPGNHRLKMTI